MSKKSNAIAQSSFYYAMRAAQRFSLYVTGLITVIFWSFMVTAAFNMGSYVYTGVPEKHHTEVQEMVTSITDGLSLYVLIWGIVTAIITLAMLLLPRVKKHDKRFVVDSLIFVVVMVLSMVLAQNLMTRFLISNGL